MFFDILRIANYHKPKLLFLENVKNLVRHDNGTTLSTIIDNLEKIGYDDCPMVDTLFVPNMVS